MDDSNYRIESVVEGQSGLEKSLEELKDQIGKTEGNINDLKKAMDDNEELEVKLNDMK